MRRPIALLLFLVSPVAAAAAAAAAAAPATRPLEDPLFTTAVPAGWHERTSGRTHFFNSGKGYANNLGLPGRGQIGLTVAVYHVKRGVTAQHVVRRHVGAPRDAEGLRWSPIRGTRLAGARAATTSARYRYKGVRWVQRDLLAVRGTRAFFIEVDAGPKKARRALATMGVVRRNWRWK